MTMTLKGDKEIIAYLETKYGKSATKRITDFTLTKAAVSYTHLTLPTILRV